MISRRRGRRTFLSTDGAAVSAHRWEDVEVEVQELEEYDNGVVTVDGCDVVL